MTNNDSESWLRESEATPAFQERLAGPLADYWQRVQSVPEVVSLEIGFTPMGQSASSRDFGDFPRDGVVHLVTIVPSNDPESKSVDDTFTRLMRVEDAIENAYQRIPVEFHIAGINGFPRRNGTQIFERICPPGTLHLASVVKPAVSVASK